MPSRDSSPRPAWNEGAIWMGANLPALWRMVGKNRGRIAPRYWLDFAIDSLFASANSMLSMAERVVCARRIRNAPIPHDPIFILGHWRTGTTLLHELLALDPAHRAPTTFECFLPGHFVLTERWLKSWTGFALPRTRWFDNMPVGWDRPQEEEFALVNLGLGSPYSAIAFPNEPPAEADYLDLDGLEPRPQARWEAGYRRFLQRLIAQRAGRLILKSPPHTCRVPTLVKLFPQAKFIYVVRDPDAIFPSTLKLWRSLYATHGYQRPNFAGLADQVLCAFAHFHARFEATKGLIPAGNLTVVRFEELTRDPPAMLRRLYAELDLGSYEAVAPLIEKFQAGQRDYQPNRHELASEQRELLRERWQSYYALHGYGA